MLGFGGGMALGGMQVAGLGINLFVRDNGELNLRMFRASLHGTKTAALALEKRMMALDNVFMRSKFGRRVSSALWLNNKNISNIVDVAGGINKIGIVGGGAMLALQFGLAKAEAETQRWERSLETVGMTQRQLGEVIKNNKSLARNPDYMLKWSEMLPTSYHLASAGMGANVQRIKEAQDMISGLGSLGPDSDIAQATDFYTQLYQSYWMDLPGSLEQVQNELKGTIAKTIQVYDTTVSKLTRGSMKAIASARQLGVGAKDVIVSIGAMTSMGFGVRPEAAGTSYLNILQRAKKAGKDLGINFTRMVNGKELVLPATQIAEKLAKVYNLMPRGGNKRESLELLVKDMESIRKAFGMQATRGLATLILDLKREREAWNGDVGLWGEMIHKYTAGSLDKLMQDAVNEWVIARNNLRNALLQDMDKHLVLTRNLGKSFGDFISAHPKGISETVSAVEKLGIALMGLNMAFYTIKFAFFSKAMMTLVWNPIGMTIVLMGVLAYKTKTFFDEMETKAHKYGGSRFPLISAAADTLLSRRERAHKEALDLADKWIGIKPREREILNGLYGIKDTRLNVVPTRFSDFVLGQAVNLFAGKKSQEVAGKKSQEVAPAPYITVPESLIKKNQYDLIGTRPQMDPALVGIYNNAGEKVSADVNGGTISIGDMKINVYPPQGADPEEIAKMVKRIFAEEAQKESYQQRLIDYSSSQQRQIDYSSRRAKELLLGK